MKLRYQHTYDETKPIPMFYPTASMDVRYIFDINTHHAADQVSVEVHSNETHAILKAAENEYRAKYKKLYTSHTSLNSANIATAALTLIYTKESLEEGVPTAFEQDTYYLISMRGNRSCNLKDYYLKKSSYNVDCADNKSSRDTDVNTNIKNRIRLASQYNLLSQAAVSTPGNFELAVRKGTFHETFHHSEQTIMSLLESGDGIKYVLNCLKESKAKSLLGITLDIFSTRYLCDNCNYGLIGMQSTQEKGFLHDLKARISHVEYRMESLDDGISLFTNVSADTDGKGTGNSLTKKSKDKDSIHEITSKMRRLVLQGDSKTIGLPKIIEDEGYSLGDYGGDFFTSREISKKKMEKAIAI